MSESKKLIIEEGVESKLTKIERAKQEWESTVDSLSQLVCLLDQQGRIMRANRTVERWELASVAKVKGMQLHELFHPHCTNRNCAMASELSQLWQTVVGGQSVEVEAENWLPRWTFEVQIRPISTETVWQDKAVESFAVVVIQDITERRRMEQEREKLIEDLEAFAHSVAHDLRDPLFQMIGFAELLKNNLPAMSAQEIQDFAGVITTSGHKMGRIIDELLLLAGVRRQEVEVEPLDMDVIVTEAQDRLTNLIEQHHARINFPERWPTVLGYGPWIEEVWVNYLSNAIRYGGRPPQVEIDAVRQPNGMVRFRVKDNGLGLKPEEQAKLFTPFTKLSQAQTKGHGLGLSITRRIVEKMGGEVGVESAGVPGQGSIFSFTLRIPNEGNGDHSA